MLTWYFTSLVHETLLRLCLPGWDAKGCDASTHWSEHTCYVVYFHITLFFLSDYDTDTVWLFLLCVFLFFFIYHQISSSFQSHYFHLARCINLPVPLSLSLLLFLLSPAMHLFGLNWQLQESESYGAFENGVGGRDTTPNTFMVSTDNGGFPRKHAMKVSLLRQS